MTFAARISSTAKLTVFRCYQAVIAESAVIRPGVSGQEFRDTDEVTTIRGSWILQFVSA
jgi:hypothetical protein